VAKVTVIDSVMGSGKTTWAMEYMEKAPAEKRFVFITPFLDQVERVVNGVKSRQFIEPDNDNKSGRKMHDLKALIVKGADICATHSLFRDADDELIELLTGAGYTLILDEAMDVVGRVNIGPQDMKTILKSDYIRIDGNRVVWIFDEYNEIRWRDIKRLAKAGNLFIYRDSFLVWTFPPRVFATFDDVITMTYLFDGQLQRYYFDMHDIKYEYKAVRLIEGRYQLCEYSRLDEKREELIKLIEIYDGKLNSVGQAPNAMGASWLKRANLDVLTPIKKNLYAYLRGQCEAKAEEIIWTTIKECRNDIKGRGFSDRFLPVNARATNDYADTWALGYVFNRFMNPNERAFFEDNGVRVNVDALAVSDLLQWVWRSRIRNGQPIRLYLPSSRMRSLLMEWSRYEI
jgi:hypothetical protein